MPPANAVLLIGVDRSANHESGAPELQYFCSRLADKRFSRVRILEE